LKASQTVDKAVTSLTVDQTKTVASLTDDFIKAVASHTVDKAVNSLTVDQTKAVAFLTVEYIKAVASQTVDIGSGFLDC
jgi:hypothetical protein